MPRTHPAARPSELRDGAGWQLLLSAGYPGAAGARRRFQSGRVNSSVMVHDPRQRWKYASLKLDQRPWPGKKKSDWVAVTAQSEEFRTPDLLAAMDRLGAAGWELTTFAPAFEDRS